MTTALILGVSGQDGSFLAEHLLKEGYRVTGTIRRHSVAETQSARIDHLDIETVYGDVTDIWSIMSALRKFEPDEVYNLAAQSHVGISFGIRDLTMQVNGMGAWNVFEAVRTVCPDAKVYQASSSEMFGNSIDADGFQRITTPMSPVSPYACAKLFAYQGARHYRNAYGMFVVNGILFNHESERRGSNFVTAKVIKTAIDIHREKVTELRLGNIDTLRDWGYAPDYVRAMHMMMQYPSAGDWVVATGQSFSVRELCDYVFGELGMDYRDYVVQDKKFMRDDELIALKGYSYPIRQAMGWKPKVSFFDMINKLIEHWKDQ